MVLPHASELSSIKVDGKGVAAVQALQGIGPRITPGEFVVLPGASGSGQSTLLNTLGGLDSATSGTAQWVHEGPIHDLTGATNAQLTRYRREHVGIVLRFYHLIPSLTARENVSLVTNIAHTPKCCCATNPGAALTAQGASKNNAPPCWRI